MLIIFIHWVQYNNGVKLSNRKHTYTTRVSPHSTHLIYPPPEGEPRTHPITIYRCSVIRRLMYPLPPTPQLPQPRAGIFHHQGKLCRPAPAPAGNTRSPLPPPRAVSITTGRGRGRGRRGSPAATHRPSGHCSGAPMTARLAGTARLLRTAHP